MIFRYPGSKAKFAVPIYAMLKPIVRRSFFDVFVGGGSILCYVATMNRTVELFANDLDPDISAFWTLISKGDVGDLVDRLSVPPTVELFYRLRESKPDGLVDHAYRAVFFNRTTFSGIAHASPIGGAEQKSKWTVDCRYNFETMKKKIYHMKGLFKGRLTVFNLDFESAMNAAPRVPLYLDPPYYDQGKALYPCFMDKKAHARLSILLRDRSRWLLSYDDHPSIRQMYKFANIKTIAANYSIRGEKTEWTKKQELLIYDEAFA